RRHRRVLAAVRTAHRDRVGGPRPARRDPHVTAPAGRRGAGRGDRAAGDRLPAGRLPPVRRARRGRHPRRDARGPGPGAAERDTRGDASCGPRPRGGGRADAARGRLRSGTGRAARPADRWGDLRRRAGAVGPGVCDRPRGGRRSDLHRLLRRSGLLVPLWCLGGAVLTGVLRSAVGSVALPLLVSASLLTSLSVSADIGMVTDGTSMYLRWGVAVVALVVMTTCWVI